VAEARAGNWIAVSRDMRDHPIVGFGRRPKPDDPSNPVCFSYAEGFLDLLMWARWEDGEILNKGRKMLVRRGQLMASHGSLAKRWNWSVKTVRGFLRTLSNDTMISTNSGVDREAGSQELGNQTGMRGGNLCSILTISNYDTYQPSAARAGQPSQHAKGNRGASNGQAKGNNLRREEGNKGSADSMCGSTAPKMRSAKEIAEEQHEVFWKLFPQLRRKKKAASRRLFVAIVTGQHRELRATSEQIIAAVKAGIGFHADPKFAPMPTSWLNGGSWEDGDCEVVGMSLERQRKLADAAIAAKNWPRDYKAGPHSPDCLFTDPDIRKLLRANFNPLNQFIGDCRLFNGHATTHPAAGEERPF
jgi:hypothetical protein